jgi:hypothetical protein
MTAPNENPPLDHQCEFTCQGCGAKVPGVYYMYGWHVPNVWFDVLTACSRRCVYVVMQKIGKAGCVMPTI